MSNIKFQHIPWFVETYSADIYSGDWFEFCVALMFFATFAPETCFSIPWWPRPPQWVPMM